MTSPSLADLIARLIPGTHVCLGAGEHEECGQIAEHRGRHVREVRTFSGSHFEVFVLWDTGFRSWASMDKLKIHLGSGQQP